MDDKKDEKQAQQNRPKEGAKDFLMIKSFTSTAAKNGFSAFRALFLLFSGKFFMGTE